ncbi:hypothetical protein Val02_87360 [Virgisporangium aliadipatigenens]|uniref:DUF3710 domain-containing protein n=1 Tax=Virgisporangium aliadipatigenens TaxID=741659 RepID=A0A8J4DV04_9ACTN|nr:DUF3710 domain-containing protein [Virgisporangium aliadipatigenens]GIJ51850.1 hypothetical protein Val02_87360 [Virgisporangium aliadipatigenens]
MIFSRKKADKGRHTARRRERDDVDTGPDEEAPSSGRSTGPYDVSEAPKDGDRIDLGGLKVPVPSGVELRVQADPDGQIQNVLLAADDSLLQLGAFAAPRTEGIWDEVREDIKEQLVQDGASADEIDGPYGVELRGRVRTPEGTTEIRFVGIDGPRWMVRAVYQGRAASDPAAAAPLDAVLEGLVVDRGHEAMPVRDPLPLRLPREMHEQAGVTAPEEAPAAPAAETPAPRKRPSPRPRR